MGDVMTKLEQDSLEDEELRIQTGVFEKWRVDDQEDHVPQSDVQLFNKLRQKIQGTPKHVYLRKILISLNNLSYDVDKARETNIIWNSLLEVINNQTPSSSFLSKLQKSKIANSKKIMKNCFCFNKFKKKRFSNVGVNTECVERKSCETMTAANSKIKASPSKDCLKPSPRNRAPKPTILSPPTTPPRRLTSSVNLSPKTPKSASTNSSPVKNNRSPLNSKRLAILSTPVKSLSPSVCLVKSSGPNVTLKRSPASPRQNNLPSPIKKISPLSPPATRSSLQSFSTTRSLITSTPQISQLSANRYRLVGNQSPFSTNSTNPLPTPSLQISQDENSRENSSLPCISCNCDCHSSTIGSMSEIFLAKSNLSTSSIAIPTSSCEKTDLSLQLPQISSLSSQPSVPLPNTSSVVPLSLPLITSIPSPTTNSIPPPPPLPKVLSSSSETQESIPPPPPLPSLTLLSPSSPPTFSHSNSTPPPPPPPPPPLPARGIIPPPPPLPAENSIPPPPPPLPMSSCIPHPPPLMPSSGLTPPPMLSNVSTCPPPPPPFFEPPLSYSNQTPSILSSDNSHPHYLSDSKNWSLPTRRFVHEEKFNSLRQRKKMKTIGWTKIPPVKLNNNSIWAQVVNVRDIDFDMDQMEELFCQKQMLNKSSAAPNTTEVSKSSLTKSVSLLDSKRSLTINIYLRQFKKGFSEVIEKVEKAQTMNVDSWKGLLKILPDSDEVKLIKGYKGDVSCLDVAEQFFHQLISIPEYRFRIEALLQQVEGPLLLDELKPQIKRVKSICEVLMSDKNLVELLGVILKLGNLVNSGTYAANAVGFKVSDLSKLTDMRANKPQMTFLHYVILVAKSNNPNILDFTSNAPLVKEALKVSLSSIEEDMNQMVKTSLRLSKELANKSDTVKQVFAVAIQEHFTRLDKLKADYNDMQSATHNLITHFCEDPKTFQLEELLQVFNNFFDGTLKADKENELRRQREEKLNRLEMNKENSKAGNIMKIPKKRGKIPDAMTGYNQEKGLVDLLMEDIRNGDFRLKSHPTTSTMMVEQTS